MSKIKSFKSIALYSLLLLFYLLVGCSSTADSNEEQLRQLIDEAVTAAEERNTSDLSKLMHKDYLGQNSLDKKHLLSYIRGYFLTHKNIYLLTKIRSFDFVTESKGHVVLHVAMAGSVISDASVLSNLRAKMYRIELEFEKDDQWLLKKAQWERANMADME